MNKNQSFIDSLTLKDFRCFHEEQTVPLAPLTLLVGENSTGKTSFMALVQALCKAARASSTQTMPDFKEGPYDLGSFDEIVHNRGSRGGRANEFMVGFSRCHEGKEKWLQYKMVYQRQSQGNFEFNPAQVFNKLGKIEVEGRTEEGRKILKLGNSRGSWQFEEKDDDWELGLSFYGLWHHIGFMHYALDSVHERKSRFKSLNNSPDITADDVRKIYRAFFHPGLRRFEQAVYSSAPVSSNPIRTYDPSRYVSSPEGRNVPMYLANIFYNDDNKWKELKSDLEKFGKDTGLFDEIRIKPLGKKNSSPPFQIQIRKYGRRNAKGPHRNLIDVGYGVSQALPLIVEILNKRTPHVFLLQQPEVHLHPSAQAALGSFFSNVVASGRHQLIIETHSDYILDRIRVMVREEKIRSDDVSILFFQRNVLEVKIRSIKLDKKGRLEGELDGYGEFFMKETERVLGYR